MVIDKKQLENLDKYIEGLLDNITDHKRFINTNINYDSELIKIQCIKKILKIREMLVKNDN